MSYKIDNTELPYSVKKALCDHITSKDNAMSQRELDNAWKCFCNVLDSDSKVTTNQKKDHIILRVLSPLFRPAFIISAASTASLLFALITYHKTTLPNGIAMFDFKNVFESSRPDSSTPKMTNEIKVADLVNEPRDYRLPQAEHFSELVTFVGQEHRSLPTPQKSMLDEKLTAELEHSLRESMYVTNSELEKSWGYNDAGSRFVAGSDANIFFVSYDR